MYTHYVYTACMCLYNNNSQHTYLYLSIQWSFDGFTWQIFSTQTFTVTGSSTTVSGYYILDKVFDLRTVDSWGMWGALVGYVVFFRFAQYMLFAYQTGSFDGMISRIASGSGQSTATGAVVGAVVVSGSGDKYTTNTTTATKVDEEKQGEYTSDNKIAVSPGDLSARVSLSIVYIVHVYVYMICVSMSRYT